ncbi:MAG: ISL3 family transposase [Methanothrix sp.]
MSQEELFRIALGLEKPWHIKTIDFKVEEKQLDLHIDFDSGSKFPCPSCGRSGCHVHDTIERTWRHLNFFQFKTYLHCRVPRTECEDCGVKQVKVPWARKSSGFTLLMDSMIVILAQHMPAKTVADIIGEHDTRIWRVLVHYVQEARSNEDLSNVHSVGVDETSRAKGHNYISVFVDLDESRVIHVCEGRDSGTVTSFKQDYEAHKGLAGDVTDFCCDMSPAFISGIESNFENAAITFDRFHIMKLMNEAVDQVRREEQAHNANLKRTRYIWLKNPENLTSRQVKELGSLKDMHLKTSRAYDLKLSLKDFWNIRDPILAELYLRKWYFWATHSRLAPVIDKARTFKHHWNGILNYINTRIDNGVLEGINSLIQAAKNIARGFRSTKNFIITIYLRLGKLHFNLPT